MSDPIFDSRTLRHDLPYLFPGQAQKEGYVNEALAHMREHNAGHSDAILTNSLANAERFVNGAGSAAVYVNASTRFTDGGQFGLGAEVAVSTQMLHARGPMGLTELTSYKWVGQADYLIRA